MIIKIIVSCSPSSQKPLYQPHSSTVHESYNTSHAFLRTCFRKPSHVIKIGYKEVQIPAKRFALLITGRNPHCPHQVSLYKNALLILKEDYGTSLPSVSASKCLVRLLCDPTCVCLEKNSIFSFLGISWICAFILTRSSLWSSWCPPAVAISGLSWYGK